MPVVCSLTVKIFNTFGWIKIMCMFFFSCKAIVPVHENLILIAYAININNTTSHDKDVV